MPEIVTRLSKCAAILIALIVLTSCQSTVTNDGGGQDIVLSTPIPTVKSESSVTLPLSTYQLSAQDHQIIWSAIVIRQNDCMESFGQRRIVSPSLPEAEPSPADRRYGQIELEQAKLYGYGYVPDKDNYANDMSSEIDPTPVELEILGGHHQDGSISERTNDAGEKLHEFGCGAQGIEAIAPNFQVDIHLLTDAWSSTRISMMDHPAVLEVPELWANCMSGYGHDFATVADAGNSIMYSEQEIQMKVATQDVTCKQKVNYAGVLYAIDTTYQNLYIQEHSSEFNELARRREDSIAVATQVLSDNP